MNCICCKNWGNCPVFDCEEDDKPFEWKDGIGFSCDLHGDGFIPDFITPAQYKERTGEDFNGAVWVLTQSSMADTGDYSLGIALMTYDEYCAECRYNPGRFKGMPSPLCVLSGKMPDPEEDFEEYPPSDDWEVVE